MTEKTVKPEIRFAGFTDAWEQRKLGEIAPLRGGFAFSSNEYCDGGIPIVRISNILSNGSVGGEFVYFKEQENDDLYSLVTGDILLAMSGATTGKVAMIKTEKPYKYYQNQRVGHFTKAKETDYLFVATIVSSDRFTEQLRNVLVAGAQPNVSSKDIDSFEFYVPKAKDEQREIGLYFNHLENLITLHQRKYDKLTNVKKSMLEKMFPKNGSNVPEIRFKGFSDAWEQRKVSELFRVTRGYVLAATQTETAKTAEKPYPVYSSQTKDKGLMGYYKDYLYEDAITWTTDGANAGTVNYRAGKFYCTNVCGVLLSNEVKANQMIAEALNNVAKGYVSYVGNPKLMNNVMADIVIQIPTQAEEREQLSSFFTNLDHLITLHQRELEKLKNIKKACLEKMFV